MFYGCDLFLWCYLGTIQILSKHVFEDFLPTSLAIREMRVLLVSKTGQILNPPTESNTYIIFEWSLSRVSVQGVKSLGGHFACLCRGFEFYEVKFFFYVIIFQKENGNTFTLFIIFIVKSLQKEQNSTNLLLWPPICWNKYAITPKWFNSLDTNSIP